MPVEVLLRSLSDQRVAFEAARRLYARRLAPGFNVFDFIAPDELSLSRILAWLLDPRGSHGQTTLFLREFLSELGLDWPTPGLDRWRVNVEQLTFDQRRVDIVVQGPDAMLVIENKAFAGDQAKQVGDYLAWLDRLAPEAYRCLVYLAGSDGRLPSEDSITGVERSARQAVGQFQATSYQRLIPWLSRTRGLCESETVSSFIDAFIHHIRERFMKVKDVTEHESLVETVRQSPDNLKSALQIIAAASDIKQAIIASVSEQIRDALTDGYVMSGFNASSAQFSGWDIEMPGISDLYFSIEYGASNYCSLVYGVSKLEGGEAIDGAKRVLDAEFGTGRVSEMWPWYRSAGLTEKAFPVARDWRTGEQQWFEAQDGTFARKAVSAARAFREVLLDRSKASSGQDMILKPCVGSTYAQRGSLSPATGAKRLYDRSLNRTGSFHRTVPRSRTPLVQTRRCTPPNCAKPSSKPPIGRPSTKVVSALEQPHQSKRLKPEHEPDRNAA